MTKPLDALIRAQVQQQAEAELDAALAGLDRAALLFMKVDMGSTARVIWSAHTSLLKEVKS